jgi:hypothetical protein
MLVGGTTLPDDTTVIESLGRRLRVVFQGAGEPDDGLRPSLDRPPAEPLLPLLEFVAYASDCVLYGRVRLAADRLTDMLNGHDEFDLVDVMVERLDGLGAVEVQAVVVPRNELLLIHATGPRGNQERRTRTREHPLAMQIGPYEVRGNLHASPGHDPLMTIRRRKAMVPITDAWIEYQVGAERRRRRVGALVVNREQIDTVAHAVDEWVEVPDSPFEAGGA